MTEIATAPTACEAPTRPVRVIWHEVACPAAHQLDATELQVGKLLEAADAVVALGLPAAGFHTLALDECAPLQQPSQRAPVVAYLAERGVTLVFAARDGKPLGADAVQLYGGAAPGVARACVAQRLAATSGAGGWNDARASLPGGGGDGFRRELLRRCALGAPVVLGSAAARALAADDRALVASPLLLAVHQEGGGAAALDVSVDEDDATRPRVEAWARELEPPATTLLLLLSHAAISASTPIHWERLPGVRLPGRGVGRRNRNRGREPLTPGGAWVRLLTSDGATGENAQPAAALGGRVVLPAQGSALLVLYSSREAAHGEAELASGGALSLRQLHTRAPLRLQLLLPVFVMLALLGGAAALGHALRRCHRLRRRLFGKYRLPPREFEGPNSPKEASPPAVAPKGGGGERRKGYATHSRESSWSAQQAAQVLAEGWQTHGQEAAAWRPVYSCPLATPPLSPPGTSTSTPGLTPSSGLTLPAAVSAAARAGNSQPRRCLDSFV